MLVRKCCFPVILVSADVLEGKKTETVTGREEGACLILVCSCPHRSNTIIRELTVLLFVKKDTDNVKYNGHGQICVSVFAVLALNVIFKYWNLHEIPL